MIAMQLFASQPWVQRLGWTLVHFLWQGLAIAILYAAVRRGIARTSTPKTRYLLACTALAAMMAAPLVTWAVVRPAYSNPAAAYRIHDTPQPPAATNTRTTTTAPPDPIHATVSTVRSSQFLPWVVVVWLIGAVFCWVRLMGGWIVAARMRSVQVRQSPPEWQEAVKKLGVRIGLSRPVRLLVSALVQVPTVVGWLRPIVFVPVGALSGLPREHLEALLLHELAHIRRHDYLVNILQSIAEALLFYHPAIWWVSAHLRAERELCCDDLAVSVSGDALTYACALAELESCRPAHLTPALAANGGSLSARIARLLGQPRPSDPPALGPGVIVVAILLLAAAYGIFAQSDPHLAFQSVSIKRNPFDWSERERHPMSVHANASLMLLIQFTYAKRDNPMRGHWMPLLASQVIGGPPWINSEGYDIETKPASDTDPKQEWLMWQTLLADRFKLRLHRETREFSGYNLIAAASGLIVRPAKEADCISFPPGTPPRHVPGKVDCGYVSGPYRGYGPGLEIVGKKVRISDLIRELAFLIDRPILDKTGFTGEFDLTLSFTPDEALRAMPGFGGPTDPALPNIFAAVEQQLGLKLVPTSSPVEVLVVDHAERPTLN